MSSIEVLLLSILIYILISYTYDIMTHSFEFYNLFMNVKYMQFWRINKIYFYRNIYDYDYQSN